MWEEAVGEAMLPLVGFGIGQSRRAQQRQP
jgi:hypothetical protein